MILILFCVGCSNKSLDQVTWNYYDGNPHLAFEIAQENANFVGREENALGSDDLLWQIQSGVIGFQLNQARALALLNRAEDRIQIFEKEGLLAGMFENLGAILVNDSFLAYRGFLYEGAMINYYKALAYMQKKDYPNARVEFNRASDRQRRAKEYYQNDIAQAQEKRQKALMTKSHYSQSLLLEQQNAMDHILSSYSNLSVFQDFNGWINPFIDYVSGIFFYIQGDRSKAQDFLKESYGISQAKMILKDLDLLRKGSEDKDRYTWILIEDGRSPSKISEGFNVTLPIFVDEELIVMNVALALPNLQKGISFAKDYTLKGEGFSQSSEEIALLNPIVFNEFQKQLPSIIARNILSTSLKLGAQVGLSQIDGLWGLLANLGALIYSKASTQADLRISSVLPNAFLAIRFKNQEGRFSLMAEERKLADIILSTHCENLTGDELCVRENHIVYIRNAHHNVFRLNLISQ